MVGNSSLNATITGGTLGLVLDYSSSGSTSSTYALWINGGTDALNGVSALTLTGNGLSLEVIRGLAPASAAALSGVVHTDVGAMTLNLSGLGTSTSTANVTSFSGTATLAVSQFISLSGTFSIASVDDTVNSRTDLLVGATNVSSFLGSPDQSFGLNIQNGQLLLAAYLPNAPNSSSSYAFQVSAAAAFNGFGAVTASGTFVAQANTIGAFSQSITVGTATQTLAFTGTQAATFTATNLALQIGNFATVTGNYTFTLTPVYDALGQTIIQDNITITGTGVSVSVGLTVGGVFTGVQVAGASFGLVMEKDLANNSAATYAFASSGGSITVSLPGVSLTATGVVVEGNTTGAAITNQTVGPVTLNFTDGSQVLEVAAQVSGSIFTPDSSSAVFASISGNIGNCTSSDASGDTEILAGASNVQIVIGTASTNVTLAGADVSLFVLIPTGGGATYALQTSGGSLTVNGLPSDLTFAITQFALQINNTGLDVSSLVGLHRIFVETSGGNVTLNFNALGGNSVQAVEGTATLTVANSGIAPAGLVFSGSFAVSAQPDTTICQPRPSHAWDSATFRLSSALRMVRVSACRSAVANSGLMWLPTPPPIPALMP